MTAEELVAARERLAAIKAACDASLSDDPPWAEIEEALQLLDRLLPEPAE